jgi:membrane fusion protein (multidrug efflux system)
LDEIGSSEANATQRGGDIAGAIPQIDDSDRRLAWLPGRPAKQSRKTSHPCPSRADQSGKAPGLPTATINMHISGLHKPLAERFANQRHDHSIFPAHLLRIIEESIEDSMNIRLHSTINTNSRSPSASRLPLSMLSLAVLCAALSACGQASSGAAAPGAPSPGARPQAEVGVVTLQAQDQVISTELPGRTTAYLSAEIRPQVGGIIKTRLFEEGTRVNAGQPLYQLDPATYQAAYNSAQASLVKARATLASARTTAERNAALVKIDAISKQTSDDSQAVLQEAQADVGTAQAALETARINLSFTKITAPIAGRVDTSTVTPGALVEANQTTALTTVQQTDPIYVDIPQSSAALLRLKQELAAGKLARTTGDQAKVRVVLEDGSVYAHEGKLLVSGATVSTSSGAVTLRAVVPNPDGLLMPGMYVRAVLDEGVAPKTLLVPQQAVTRTSSGAASVLTVGAGGKVEKHGLTVDRAIGNAWQVTGGLTAGQQVIVEGSQKISVGDAVKAVPASLAAGTTAKTVASAQAGTAAIVKE